MSESMWSLRQHPLLPLLATLVFALSLGCAKPAEEPERADEPDAEEPSRKDEAPPTGKPLSPPPGFPLELMEGDRILQSQSYPLEGAQVYEVHIESNLDEEAIADYWAAELGRVGITTERSVVEEEAGKRISLEGSGEASDEARVTVMAPNPQEDEVPPKRVSIYLRKG